MNHLFFIAFFNLPPGIQNSVEIAQPELVVFFLLPILLLFPLIAMIIVLFTKEDVATPDKEKTEVKRESIPEKIARGMKRPSKTREDRKSEEDEWDQALEKDFKR
jgi:uncharacterized membrane protein